jgi:predicted homoserine dehydrogenase-like protein
VAALKDDIQVQSGYIAEMEATEPAAMRRALKAEAEVVNLNARVEALLTTIDVERTGRKEAEAEVAALKQENGLLRMRVESDLVMGNARAEQADATAARLRQALVEARADLMATMTLDRRIDDALETIDAALAAKEA